MPDPTEIKISGWRDFIQPSAGERIPWTREVLAPAVAASDAVMIDFEFITICAGTDRAIGDWNVAGSARLEAREDGLYAVGLVWSERAWHEVRRYSHLVPALEMTPGPEYRALKFIGLGLTSQPIAGFEPIDWGTDG